MNGHLFVAYADLLRIDADAILVPTDEWLSVTPSFGEAVDLPQGGDLDSRSFMGAGEGLVGEFRRTRDEDDRICYLAKIGSFECTSDEEADGLLQRIRQAVDEFVRAASASAAVRGHAKSHQRDLPRLALPFVGTGEGGLARFPGRIVRLIDHLASVTREQDCDLVLCIVDESQWSATQRVRLENHERYWSLSDADEDLAQEIARHARSGALVLFVGAGVSRDAGLKDWRGLLRELAVDVGLLPEEVDAGDKAERAFDALDPRDAASLVEAQLAKRELAPLDGRSSPASLVGRVELLARLQAHLGEVRTFGLTHALLASLPVKEVVTTNFDRLFEAAWKRPGEAAASVIPYEPVRSTGRWILKLHGSLPEGTEFGRGDDIVLTRSDFSAQARLRGALLGIVQAMLATRHLLFVGYSLSDDDFHLLADEVRMALRGTVGRRGTVITFGEPLWAELWEDLLRVVSLGSEGEEDPGRRLHLVLDRAASLSAPRFRDLLGAGYELSDDEKKAREALLEVERELPR